MTVERTGYLVGTVLILSGLVHLAILLIGGGSWEGPLSWRKPMTFGFSFGLTLITIVWLSSFLALRARTRAILVGLFTFACAIETTLVSLQRWRGVPSHFNRETPVDGVITGMLAIFGIMLVALILTLAIASFHRNPAVPPSMRAAIRIGLVALVAAQVTGALMIARGMTLVFAGNPQAAYATGGAFKPTHAATMHAIQLLPGLAWLLSFSDWSEQRRLSVVLAVGLGYLLVAGAIALSNFTGVL